MREYTRNIIVQSILWFGGRRGGSALKKKSKNYILKKNKYSVNPMSAYKTNLYSKLLPQTPYTVVRLD